MPSPINKAYSAPPGAVLRVGFTPPAPVAQFIGSPLTGSIPFTVTFTDQSSGLISSWLWDFGDGGTSTSQNPTHAYTVAGNYTVALTVTGIGGSNTQTRTTYVTASTPVATQLVLSFPSTGVTNTPVTVTVTPNGPIGVAGTSTLAVNVGTLGTTTFSWTPGQTSAQTTTLNRVADGTSTVTLTNSMSLTNTGSGSTYTSSASVPPAVSLTRLTSPNLFVDVKASTAVTGGDFGGAIVIPARPDVTAPKDDFLVGVYGPHNDFVDIYAGWRWTNAGGDWIDANGTWQGTAAPHFTFTANSVTTGSATYTGVVCTEAAKAAFWRGKWNAFIVKCVGGTRALAALHHPTLAAPVMRVTYTDTTTADLACIACVRLVNGSAYTHIGSQQAIISNSVALEFDMPTKEVSSATIDFVVSSHTATAATINGYTVNPPTAAGTEELGISANYPEDIGLSSHPAVLFHQRFTDGTVLSDYVIQSPSGVDPGSFSNWSPVVYGGVDDPTKLPTAIGGAQVAGSNKWFQVNAPAAGGGFSIVNSSYTGEGFVPFGPGRGAMRIVLPGATVADGGAIGNYSSVLAADLRYMFDKAICGNLDEIWVRQTIRLGWAPKTMAATKMLREVGGGSARYSIPKGKFGVGAHHAGPYGGNSNTGGNNLGHSARLGFESPGADFTNASSYAYVHAQDMLPDRNNTAFGTNGLGAGFFANQTYVIECRLKLNTYNASGAIGTSPADGEVQTWINGVDAGTQTGLKWRDGAIDYGTTPNGPTYIAPFGDLGFTGLWLNVFHGGTLPPETDLVMFIGDICAATQYIGRTRPALPSWVPVAGGVTEMTVANGLLTNNFRSVAAPYYQGYYLAGTADNYNGAVSNFNYGPYGAVIFEGGGHSYSNDNSVVQLDLGATSATFRRLNDPTPLFGTGTDTTTKDNNSTADVTGTLVNLADLTYTTDGQPASSHSYGDQVVAAPHHAGGSPFGTFYKLLREGPSRTYNANGAEAPFKMDFDTYGASTYTYSKAGVVRFAGSNLNITGGPNWSVHVPAQNRIYVESHNGSRPVRWFDLMLCKYIDGTGTQLVGTGQGNGGQMLYVPTRKLILLANRNSGSGNMQIRYMDVSTLNPGWNNTAVTLSATITVSDDWSEIAWCSTSGKLIVGNTAAGGTTIYEITIPATLSSTWTVVSTTIASGGSIGYRSAGAGIGYNRWSYNPKTRTINYLVKAAYDNTMTAQEVLYAYRPLGT